MKNEKIEKLKSLIQERIVPSIIEELVERVRALDECEDYHEWEMSYTEDEYIWLHEIDSDEALDIWEEAGRPQEELETGDCEFCGEFCDCYDSYNGDYDIQGFIQGLACMFMTKELGVNVSNLGDRILVDYDTAEDVDKVDEYVKNYTNE